jgi:5-methyltetrahydrofolate--homocysteine methyltransferase
MTLKEKLTTGTLILDGGMGTQLMARGASGNNERWGAEHRDDLVEIHRAYLGAGAHAITTNTFGGTRIKLEKAGLGDRTVELNTTLAGIAREAVGDSAWVLGDVGPTGDFLQPYGLLTEEQMIAVFSEQIEALVAGGIDGVIIETMMDPNEAACAIKAAKRVAPALPVLATMTFDRNPTGFRSMMGTRPGDGAAIMVEAGADAVGANCGGITIREFPELLSEMAAQVDVPLIAQANAGLPEVEDGITIFREEPVAFREGVQALIDVGAKAIGGCCGTTPPHIAALRETISD